MEFSMLFDMKKQLSRKKSNLLSKNKPGNVTLLVYYPLSIVFCVELLMIKIASIRNFGKFVWLRVQKSGCGQFQKIFKFCQSHHLSEMSIFCENQIWVKVSSFYFVAFNLLSFHFFQERGFIDRTTWQLTRINFMLCYDFRIFEATCRWLWL